LVENGVVSTWAKSILSLNLTLNFFDFI